MHGITRLEVLEEPAQQAAVVDWLLGFRADELHVAAEAARHAFLCREVRSLWS